MRAKDLVGALGHRVRLESLERIECGKLTDIEDGPSGDDVRVALDHLGHSFVIDDSWHMSFYAV